MSFASFFDFVVSFLPLLLWEYFLPSGVFYLIVLIVAWMKAGFPHLGSSAIPAVIELCHLTGARHFGHFGYKNPCLPNIPVSYKA